MRWIMYCALMGIGFVVSWTTPVASAQPLAALPPAPIPAFARTSSSSVPLGSYAPNTTGIQTAVQSYGLNDTSPTEISGAVDYQPAPYEPVLSGTYPGDAYPSNSYSSGIGDGSWLRMNTPLSHQLLDFQNRQTDKELFILQDGSYNYAGSPYLTVGAQGRFSFLGARTNATNKFPYLGRFPTDFHGNYASDVRILQANSQVTARVTSWASVYAELLFSDVFTFGSFQQGSLQTRQAYAVLGNLNNSPFFAYIGKKNVGFGDMQTLSPFTQALTWHYFAALAEGVGAGYHGNSLDMTVAAINGGRGIRVADSVERGDLNNFASNIAYTFGQTPDRRLRLGSGVLYGTIYDGFTAEHLDLNQFGPNYNTAWDVNARLDWGRWIFGGEYISTVRPWPVTATRVSAFRAEGAYRLDSVRPSRLSVSWSEGVQGPPGSQFEFNRQLVLGYGVQVHPNAFLTAEYVRSSGFAPLLDITTISDRSVVQDSAVLGLGLYF